MSSVLLILPDFMIILLGYLLRQFLKNSFFNEGFWKGTEKLVFYVLFPPMLFTSVANAKLSLAEAGTFLSVGIAAMMGGVLFSYAIRLFIKGDGVTHASAFHCGFRFNTYIGFAIVSRLYGQEGLAVMSLLIAFWVPISNSIAVAALASAVAKKEQTVNEGGALMKTLKSIFTNPLIIATSAGLVVNISGLAMPEVVMHFFKSLGNASLAMGLLCIGAVLKIQGLVSQWPLITGNTIERLFVLPAFALVMCLVFGLPTVAAGALMCFAMLPTAQSCYVMTAAMRGDAPLVAGITTAHTLTAIVSIPFWIEVITKYIPL